MKKVKLFTKLAVFGTCLCAPLLLTGCLESEESKVSFRVEDGYIQVTEDGETWKNLIDIDDLKGEPGEPGQPGQAVDGKQVQFQVTETHIQWRYVGEQNWRDLIELEDLKGEPGDNGNNADVWTIGEDGYWYKNGTKTEHKAIGEDLSQEKYTVTFNYNNPLVNIDEDIKDYANKGVDSLELSHGSWCGDSFPNYDGTLFAESFKGWFIDGTDIEIKKYDNIGGNITLVAKWENVNVEAENSSYASDLWVTDGCVFNIDLNQKNIIVPDYYKTSSGLKKVRAVRRMQEHTTGTEYALESIKLPTFLTKFWQENEAYPDGIFEGCTNLKEIEIPDTVTTLGQNAFDNCKSLESIKLPSGMTTLQSFTFYQCTNLKVVELSNNLITIENGAFAECENLRTIKIPNGVTSIKYDVFRNCSNLKTIYLPKGLETIQSSLNVENLYYGGTIEDWLNINIIDCSVFGRNETSFFVMNKYDELYEVTELNIPNTVVEIKANAFRGFKKLIKLTLSNSVKSIGEYAFYECKNLVYADLGDGVETIGEYAISTCLGLETLILPISVKNIDEAALGATGAPNSKLYYKGDKSSWDLIVKDNYYNLMAGFKVLYYSSAKPTEEGTYWHYDTDGKTPVVWEI